MIGRYSGVFDIKDLSYMRYDAQGVYEFPQTVVHIVENEGVLCQSGGSASDDLEPGTSWEDKLWKDLD